MFTTLVVFSKAALRVFLPANWLLQQMWAKKCAFFASQRCICAPSHTLAMLLPTFPCTAHTSPMADKSIGDLRLFLGFLQGFAVCLVQGLYSEMQEQPRPQSSSSPTLSTRLYLQQPNPSFLFLLVLHLSVRQPDSGYGLRRDFTSSKAIKLCLRAVLSCWRRW